MARRIAFVIGSILSALLAMHHSPPPAYVVERLDAPEPTPTPTPVVRSTPRLRQPGATWSSSWRPYRLVPERGR